MHINPGKSEPQVQAVLPLPCTGIARGQQGVFVGHPDGIWAFASDLTRTAEADLELPGSDVHDVNVSPAGNLVVAETGRDRLAFYSEGGASVSVWTPTVEGADRCHLNSTTFFNGALLVAMFDAEGRGEPWGERLDGVIAEVNPLRPGKFKPLWADVEHPHSLVAVDRELWWCDSRRCRVMRNGTEVARLPGYTRGLAVTEAWVVVGQSRSDNHSAKFEGFGSCGVWCYPKEGQVLGEPLVVELPSTEVYDVLPIPDEEVFQARGHQVMVGDALKYHMHLDLRDKNSSQVQLALLTGSNKRVLEVGPATGYLTEVLVRQGCRVTAIEKDQAAATIAAKFCERMIVGDVEEIDLAATFANERFDVVMFGDILEHLVDPQDVLAQAAGLLGPNGYVVASVPNIAHGSIRLALLNGQFRYTELGLLDKTHLNFFTKESLQSFFREAGYVIRTWRSTTVDPFMTELELREGDYPPHLVASLRDDPLALVYQFVVKAYPVKRRTSHKTADAVSSDRPETGVLKALRQREEEFAEQRAALAERDAALAEKDRALAEKDRALAQRDSVLADKDASLSKTEAALAERESLLASRDQSLGQLTKELTDIRRSRGYRLLEGYRRGIRWLFPPGSWRGLPYRAVRRVVRLLVDLYSHQRSLIQRALKARRRYGTRAALGKSLNYLARGPAAPIDPIQYALTVDWRSQQRAQMDIRYPLNIDSPAVNWVIPTLGEGGGHRTIFRFVEHLAKRAFRQRIYEMPVGGPPRSSEDELRSLIQQLYGVSMKEAYNEFEDLAPSDITFATSWHTAYPVAKFAETRKKLYFVQDFEPYFAPVGTESALAENTYRFGFHGITAGRWLAGKLQREFAMECDFFNLAADTQVYFPRRMDDRKKIVFYARRATPRRGFELGAKALEIFHARNPGYEIVFVGGDLAEKSFAFPMTSVGYVSEDALNTLYNQSAAALVVSLTNCSLLPLEIMATGCPVVTTVGENNELVLPPDSALFSAPSPQHLAEALENAVANPPQREKLIGKASQFRWEDETARVEAILRGLLEEPS